MPRRTLDVGRDIEYLQVLDDDGQVLEEDLVPDIDDEILRRMHRTMVLSRRLDEYSLQWQRQGKVGTFAPPFGQEASQMAVACLQDQDWFVPSYRDRAGLIWRGTPISQLIIYDAGYNEGGAIDEDAHDLPPAIPVGSQLPHAVGLAYASKYRETDEVTMVFFGEGATSEGDFHESMNFAAVWRLPVVFLCQNNQWAISVPLSKQTASETIAQKAIAYGMPGIQVDGNDLLAVWTATQEAIERARSGEGPTLIECVTYRLWFHTTADDPSKYRNEEEVEAWKEYDPMPRLQNYLKQRGVLDDDEIEQVEEEVDEEIQAAWDEAEERMENLGGPEVMFDHIWAERPPYLEEQREAFVGSED